MKEFGPKLSFIVLVDMRELHIEMLCMEAFLIIVKRPRSDLLVSNLDRLSVILLFKEIMFQPSGPNYWVLENQRPISPRISTFVSIFMRLL